MEGYPLVSIIVLNYNSMKFIKTCIESVLQSCYPNFEVVLVDNDSNDGSVELIRTIFGDDKRIRFICNTENYGYAKGNNIGMEHAKGDYVVIINPDVRIYDRFWLKKLVDVMLTDESIGIATPAILSYDSENVQATGMGFLYPFCTVFALHKNWSYSSLLKKCPRPFPVFVAGGECMIVRKEVLDHIGVFDTTYFMYYEEVDLCWRTWIGGFSVVAVPTSVVHHYSGGSTDVNKNYPLVAYCYAKNSTRTVLKNAGSKYVFVLLMSAQLLGLAGKLYILLRCGRVEGLYQYLRALWSNLKNLPEIMVQRKEIQRRVRQVDDDEYLWKVVRHLSLGEMIRRHNSTATFRAQMKKIIRK